MKRKAPLTMMELMVMTVVFALCAALCLQAFVESDRLSRRAEARDRAAVLCQSVAEVIRHNGGDLVGAMTQVNGTAPKQREGFGWFEGYDDNWQTFSTGSSSYTLRVKELDSALPGLGRAQVEVFVWERGEMESIFSIEISWQKGVTPNG